MAAETGIPTVYMEHQLPLGQSKKNKGSLIEHLRHKSSQLRSWSDSIKAVRSSVVERRTKSDPSASVPEVQDCLDTLQKAMKVISHQTLKERLDLIGRQLGLSTHIQEHSISLGMDAFHMDVLLGEDGGISAVKLVNQGDTMDCPDLKDILMRGNFSEFVEHLHGLQSIYQVTSDEKLKSKAFVALQALEKDLNQLAQFQNSISGVANYIHKCPLGIMLPRLAGKPMKLIYFVSPYDLLDKKSLKAHPLTVEAITDNFLGQSVTVCIEPVPETAPLNKLQTMPLMNVSKTQDGKSHPIFSGFSQMNSMMLPASFVLVLPQSIPVSKSIIDKITHVTTLEIQKESESQSLQALILQTFSKKKITDCKKLFVSLPDQHHVYFLDGMNGGGQEQEGVLISRIPFTHPTHVPTILNLLRQQLLFNIVISSCIRPGAEKVNTSNSIVFEVTAVSLQQLTIVFEHPAFDAMITVDIDLSDITNLKCSVTCSNSEHTYCSDEAISRVFQRCMSVPIMLRWLISKGRAQLDKLKEEALAAEKERLEKLLLQRELQQKQPKSQPPSLLSKVRPPPQPPHPPPLPPPPGYPHPPHHNSMAASTNNGQSGMGMLSHNFNEPHVMAGFDEFRKMTEGGNNGQMMAGDGSLLSPDPDSAHNPLLSTLLDEEKLGGQGGGASEVHDSPMLSRLLDDNISVATTVIPMNLKPAPNPPLKRQRKRRSQSDFSGPSPKHKFSESDTSDRHLSMGSSMDLDMGPSSMEQSMGGRITTLPTSGMGPMHPAGHHPHHHHPQLHHQSVLNHSSSGMVRNQSNVIDLTGESSLKKLTDTMNKHLKSEPDLSKVLNESDPAISAAATVRMPTVLQNSPSSSSKNEKASTSLEGFLLKGSGEVGRAKDYDPSDGNTQVLHHGTTPTHSKLSSLLLAPSDGPHPALNAPYKHNSSFFSDKLGAETPVSYGASMANKNTISNAVVHQDVSVPPAATSARKGQLRQSLSVDEVTDKSNMGIFEKFDLPSRQQQQQIKPEAVERDTKPPQPTEGKVSIKLTLKQQNSMKPSVKTSNSFDESEMTYGKSNNITTFDFKSDEDEDDSIMQFVDRYVYSSSPTRLQISTNKQKRLADSTLTHKADKPKKKDKNSGNTTKRKRDKEESKREKKRKKTEHIVQESVYRTVENDEKADFKLKIRVAKKPASDKLDANSDMKGQSYEISKKTPVPPSPVEKQDSRESISPVPEVVKDKELMNSGQQKSSPSLSSKNVSVHKSSAKSGSSKGSAAATSGNKTDPKLVSKPSIRLKPLTMPSSGSTVNIGPKSAGTSSSSSGTAKQEKRSASTSTPISEKRSALNALIERRASSSSAERRSSSQGAAPSTPTTAPVTTAAVSLSLQSFLPNVSKIASLPRIPKLTSSSSNTSISRTSTLDPGTGPAPGSAGTKSNNSYNMGPAGRPNSGNMAGQQTGSSKFSGNNSAGGTPFFNSRPSTPTSGNRQNSGFSANRTPGSAHRQPSPLLNSGQSMPSRPQGASGMGNRANSAGNNSTTGGVNNQKTGSNLANSHKSSGFMNYNAAGKGNQAGTTNSNPASKSAGSSAKISSNNSISSSPKNGSSSGASQKHPTSANSAGVQRHQASSALQNNYPSRPSSSQNSSSSSSSSVSRSPNTSSITKSPNYSKSPSVSMLGKSPSVGASGRSPNISHSSSSTKSPNINSSGSSRPANMNPSRSPSLSSSSSSQVARSSQNTVKPSNSSARQSPNGTKSPTVNKPVTCTANSKISTSSKPLSSNSIVTSELSTTNKPSPPKPTCKTIEASSIASTATSTTVTTPSKISTSTATPSPLARASSVSSSLTSRSPNQSSTGSPAMPTSILKNSFSQRSSSPTVSSANLKDRSTPPGTATKAPSSDNTEPSSITTPQAVVSLTASSTPSQTPNTSTSSFSNKGSKPPGALTPSDKPSTPSSMPSTPLSANADNKNKFSFPASRGRKNSLSAIVDKLKNNVGGGSLDSILSPPSSFSNQNVTSSKPTTVTNNPKTQFTDSHLGGEVLRPDENKNPSSPNKEKKVLSTNSKQIPSTAVATSEKTGGGINPSVATESPQEAGSKVQSEHNKGVTKDSNVSHVKSLEKSDSCEKILSATCETSLISSQKVSSGMNSEPTVPPGNVKHLQSTSSSDSVNSPTPKSGNKPKKEGESVFKMPSIVGSGNGGEDEKGPKLSAEKSVTPANIDENGPNTDKRPNTSDRKPSKPLASPLSDISSPENSLIIDDEVSPRVAMKLASDKSSSNVTTNQVDVVAIGKTDSGPVQGKESPEDVKASSSSSGSGSQVTVMTSKDLNKSSKSPNHTKSQSGASTPKDSDSLLDIDDDLMDVALGFGS